MCSCNSPQPSIRIVVNSSTGADALWKWIVRMDIKIGFPVNVLTYIPKICVLKI
jgi:hypothetical protein